jgi:hypothetical protein
LVLSKTWGRKDDAGSDVIARPTCLRGKKEGGVPIWKEGEVGRGPLLLLGRSAAPQAFLFLLSLAFSFFYFYLKLLQINSKLI